MDIRQLAVTNLATVSFGHGRPEDGDMDNARHIGGPDFLRLGRDEGPTWPLVFSS